MRPGPERRDAGKKNMTARRSLALLAVVLALPMLAPGDALAAGRAGPKQLHPITATDNRPRLYIVEMVAPPAVNEPRLRASTFAAGGKAGRFDVRAQAVSRYAEDLTASHEQVLQAIGAPATKIQSYRYTLNGFSARLTPAQARALARRKDVRRVWEQGFRHLSTNASPGFLGLTEKPGGLWSDRKLLGDGVIIGVIDSGITPQHPSFSDKRPAKRPRLCRTDWARNSLLGLWLCRRYKVQEDEVVYTRPADWKGTCQAGEDFDATDCNNKLIGARYYQEGFLQEYALDANEFTSPRDADGHGTHIASIAAGNRVKASIGGASLTDVSGMAPRAYLAVYKACWLEPGADRGSCSTADLVNAIEDAVADGVDIISYSVGGDDDIVGPDSIALLNATNAGVLAVTAAGNSGPEVGTVESPAVAPWVVAVGASTRRGTHYQGAIQVTKPATVAADYADVEAAFTPTLRTKGPVSGELVLVDDNVKGAFEDGQGNVVLGTVNDGCETIQNGSDVSGKIALVERVANTCTFDERLSNAARAGAAAVIVFNRDGDPFIMAGTRNIVSIPAVMIGKDDGETLLARLDAGDTVEVTLDSKLTLKSTDQGNELAAFSARGPNPWDADLLKPDVVAPGVDILAAQTPDVANGVRGEKFQYLSGTSMAVPHVAGVAALLREAHPDWSPAALKSALVTTARQDIVLEDGETPADPFDFGGGHIVPNAAVSPGLVYDAGTDDYDAYICGLGVERDGADCAALESEGRSTAATDLNLPSMAVSRLVSEKLVHRRVTNVGPPATFAATVEAPSTLDVTVEPSSLSLGTGESADFTVRFAGNGGSFDAWEFGAVTWTAGTTAVRSPFAVKAEAFEVPGAVAGTGASGELAIDVRFGYTGSYTATLAGIEASGQDQPDATKSQLTGAVVQNSYGSGYTFVQPGEGAVPASVRRIPIVVPAGTKLLRVALFDAATDGNDDLDLYLYHCPGYGTCTEESDPSAGDGSDETIDVLDPAPGEYYVDVHGYATDGPNAVFDLFMWTLGASEGNATLSAPASATAGGSASLGLTWQNLPAGRNLGLVTHASGTGDLAYTVVELGP